MNNIKNIFENIDDFANKIGEFLKQEAEDQLIVETKVDINQKINYFENEIYIIDTDIYDTEIPYRFPEFLMTTILVSKKDIKIIYYRWIEIIECDTPYNINKDHTFTLLEEPEINNINHGFYDSLNDFIKKLINTH